MKNSGFISRQGTHSRRITAGLFTAIFLAFLVLAPSATAQDKALESLHAIGNAFASVAKKASPAVVFIKVQKTVKATSPFGPFTPFGNDFFQHFFGYGFPSQPAPPQKQLIIGQGSGFIISPDGYILTNNHVVGDADKVLVKLLDGRQFEAKTIGTDPPTDVAVIKIKAHNLPVLPLGDSAKLKVGQWVLALGNPFGLSHTVTAGIVSAKGRSSLGIEDYENFIQTDAAINPGNSGGPLINLEGQVVGMNTAIVSRSGGSMGIGFAIPINMVKKIRDQLIKEGTVTRGYLGVTIQQITPDLAKTFGLKKAKGVLVSQVGKATPAEKAGLKQGDVIISFGGKPVDKIGAFRNEVALTKPGTRQSLTVLRGGKSIQLTVTIGKLPAHGWQRTGAASHSLQKLGISVTPLTPQLAARMGYQGETGVVVAQVAPGSVATLAGIQPGMLIQEVNHQPVHSVEEFEQAVENTKAGRPVLLLIKDRNGSRYVALNVE